MDYLKLFQNHSEYEAFVSGGTMMKPNVSHCVQENEVHYNPIGWEDKNLTFVILSSGTIVWQSRWDDSRTISYSMDNGSTWEDITSSSSGESFNVVTGDKVMFKGRDLQEEEFFVGTFSASTAEFNVEGNITSLVNWGGN